MNVRKVLRATAVLGALATLSAVAYGAISSPRDVHVAFEAVGPAGMKIEGTTGEMSVVESDGNVVVDVPLANLTTGIALRDRHMKEKYLEVSKYPSASLSVARTALKLPPSGGKSESDAPGVLTIHGKPHAVTVHYVAAAEPGGFAVDGRFRVKMSDHGIEVPTYMGVTVKPDVDVTARFHVTE